MRHVKQWAGVFGKCAVAVWLVHVATGVGLLQAMAALCLFLWAGLLAMHALEKLLRALWGTPSEGDDGGGPEKRLKVVIHPEPEEEPIYPIEPPNPGYRKWWRN